MAEARIEKKFVCIIFVERHPTGENVELFNFGNVEYQKFKQFTVKLVIFQCLSLTGILLSN